MQTWFIRVLFILLLEEADRSNFTCLADTYSHLHLLSPETSEIHRLVLFLLNKPQTLHIHVVKTSERKLQIWLIVSNFAGIDPPEGVGSGQIIIRKKKTGKWIKLLERNFLLSEHQNKIKLPGFWEHSSIKPSVLSIVESRYTSAGYSAENRELLWPWRPHNDLPRSSFAAA